MNASEVKAALVAEFGKPWYEVPLLDEDGEPIGDGWHLTYRNGDYEVELDIDQDGRISYLLVALTYEEAENISLDQARLLVNWTKQLPRFRRQPPSHNEG